MGSLLIEQHESALGAWLHASWSPPVGTELHGHVRCIWYFDGVLLARRERVFPDGAIEIIVQLDEPHSPADAFETQGFPPVCVTGLRLRAETVLAPPGRCRVMGLILLPPSAHLVLRESLALLTGMTADLHDFVGRAASELAERIDDSAHPGAAIESARAWLRERLVRKPPGRGTFRDVCGVPPKRYQRILRFRRTLDALAHRGASLADIAGAEGYYDQAHFTNEFREHSGMSPTAFLRSEAFPAGTSLAEP